MASVKITNALRTRILTALLEQGGFYKAEEIKEQAYEKACHTFYHHVFKSYLSSFAFLNKRFFRYSGAFSITFATDDINKGIDRSLIYRWKTLKIYVPNGYPSPFHDMTLDELGITHDNEHLQALLTVRKDWNDAVLKRKEASDKAMRVLNSVNTTNQLLKVWADIEPVLAKVIPQQTTKYPISEPITDLNELFGLKKEDK